MNSILQASPAGYYLRIIQNVLSAVDWWLIAATAFLVCTGLNILHYSQHTLEYYTKQLEFMWAGVALAVIFARIPYYFWTSKYVVPVIYVANLALLLAVMVKGHSAQGAQRWLALGPITLQPSEIAKIVVIFTIAAWLKKFPIKSFFDIFKVIGIIIPPAILVFKQPDLGTSLTFGAVFLGTVFWSGGTITDILVLISPLISLVLDAVNPQWWLFFLPTLAVILLLFWRHKNWHWAIRILMIILIVGANYGAGIARPHMWNLLKEYQQKRLTSFVNPYEDPRGSGYHILQSLIAIGSGGINGTGLGKGNQSQGAFIPERHTDFIFAVLGEELGFKIAVCVVIAYATICIRGLIIAYRSREDPAGSVMAIGLMCMFLFHVFINIGMTIGIMPVAGVPLPFLSYGGTALLVDLVSIGLLQSIYAYGRTKKESVIQAAKPPAKGLFSEWSEMIKLEHTVFALPFALSGLLLASASWPSLQTVFWTITAFAGARAAAMTLNRLIDAKIDARNPRTQERSIPAGRITVKQAALFSVASFVVMFVAATRLPPLCMQLLPVAVVILSLYSFTKRFTWLCHIVLGIAIGGAALGGWVAAGGSLLDRAAWILMLAVATWVGSFDIIYACQDFEVDLSEKLHSIPARFGVSNALIVSSALHVVTVLSLIAVGILCHLGAFYWVGFAIVVGMLIYEHSIVKPTDLSRVNAAFFTINGVVSILMFFAILLNKLFK